MDPFQAVSGLASLSTARRHSITCSVVVLHPTLRGGLFLSWHHWTAALHLTYKHFIYLFVLINSSHQLPLNDHVSGLTQELISEQLQGKFDYAGFKGLRPIRIPWAVTLTIFDPSHVPPVTNTRTLMISALSAESPVTSAWFHWLLCKWCVADSKPWQEWA